MIDQLVKQTDCELRQVINLHQELLKENSYCYFELAYTRQTDWMIWICSNAREFDPKRKVLLCGQGATPNEAAQAGLSKYLAEQSNERD